MKNRISKSLLAAAVLSTIVISSAVNADDWTQGMLITGDKTISSDSNFSNYHGVNQGVLVNWGTGTVTVTGDSTALFENNTGASDAGGALYNAYGGTVIIDAVSEFTGNNANRGGAVWNNGNLRFEEKAIFDGNSALTTSVSNDYAGGAIINSKFNNESGSGDLAFNKGVVFSNNHAIQGGAIKQGGNLTVTGDAVFQNNTADLNGGAVLSAAGWGEGVRKDSYDNITASGNIAGQNGGAFYIGDADGVLQITESGVFQNNQAKTGSGGAIYNVGVINAQNVAFGELVKDAEGNIIGAQNGNTAAVQGGAIMNAAGAEATFAGSTIFAGNTANQGGAVLNHGEGSTIDFGDGAIFAYNTANSVGGAVSTVDTGSGKTIIGDDALFIGNKSIGGQGGAVHNQRANTEIGDKAKFYNNTAVGYGGGAIYQDTDGAISSVTIGNKAEFIGNSSSSSHGGAIMNFNANNGATITIGEGAIFENNTAAKTGGAISNWGSETEVGKNTQFIGNSATGNGGAIYNAIYGGKVAVLTVNGKTSFVDNTSSAQGGAIYNAGTAILDTSTGDITFAENTAAGALNDIYAIDGSKTYLQGTNTVSIGSGIAGTANAVINNEKAKLVLETGSLNDEFKGIYNQTGGSVEVNSEFLGGTSNIQAGSVNLNGGSSVGLNSNIVLSDGASINVNQNLENSGTVTINGKISSDAANGGSVSLTDGNLVINGDMSGFKGSFVQDGDVDTTTTINDGATFFGGTNDINSGTLVVKQGAILANDITINDYSVAIDLDGREYDLSVDGIQISQNGSIKGALNLENTEVKVDKTTGIQSDIYVGQGSTLVNNDDSNSTDLAVGDKTHNVTVSLGSGFETTEDHVFNVANGSTVSLTPNADSEKAGGTLTLNGTIKGGTAANILVDGTELKTGEGKYSTGTVIINSINDEFIGTYNQNDGTVIVNKDAVFFKGTNNINTIEDTDLPDTYKSGSLVLEDGALLSNNVKINGNDDASVGDLASVTFKGDAMGKSGVANDITQEDIKNGVFKYAATETATGNTVQVNNAGVLFSNGTVIKELDAATNSLVLSKDEGVRVRLLGFGNGSGVEGDVTLGEKTGLVYTDGAYINNDTALNMTNADLVFANNSSDINYGVNINETSSGNISMYGSGTTSVSSKLNANINVAVENGVLNLDNKTTTSIGDVSANEGAINLKADNLSVKNVKVSGQNGAANFNGNITQGGVASVVDGGTLGLMGNAKLDSVTANNGNLNLTNSAVNTVNIDNLTVNGDSSIFFDADPRSQQTDTIIVNNQISAGDGTDTDPYKQVIVGGINFTQSPIDSNVQFDISNLIQGNSTNPNLIRLPDGGIVTNTAMGQYLLTSSGAGTPMVTANLTYLNPQMYRGQVATIAAWQNQLVVNNMLFDHMNLVTRKLMDDERTANKYAAAVPQIDPYQYNIQDGSLWFKAYGAFETLSMTKGLNVGNNLYGSLIGADFPLIKLKNGWKLVPTAYIGYNGAHQHFNGVSMYQNGAQLGVMGTAYKGDFMTSLMAYGGGYANDMTVRGDYGNGSDTTGNWFAGVASKSAYNIRLPHDFIIQPAFMAAYNAFGQQNWGSNFGSMSMSSGMLNGLNVAPGLNFIWQKKTFSIYAMTQLVYNVMGGVDGKAGNIDLGYVRMRHCYFEYGLGVMKKFKDTFSGYLQFTIRNGGRTGIGFSGGLQWKVGKE